MNIFYLDSDPELAAQYHNDRHVRKMIIETAQLLSTAHRVIDGEEYVDFSKSGRRVKRWKLKHGEDVFYKATHVNHPSAKWVRESADNYYWTYQLFSYLSKEFEYRWGKQHKTWVDLGGWLQSVPTGLIDVGWSDPPMAMDEKYRRDNVVEAYRNYYRLGKSHLANWTRREKPEWY